MKPRPAEPLLRDIQTLFHTGSVGGLSDGELLDRFVARGDEAAFEVLVHRLGPMVLGVCRRTLRHPHDAEDAFQATFLVLARRAASVDPPERVGPWLYGVARRVAERARTVRARRHSRESAAEAGPEAAVQSASDLDELLPLLDRELGRLPEKYRAPIVLCHLEGKPYKEAARQLGCPEGTLSGRLTRGRALLAARLTRLGMAISAGAVANVLAKEASAHVPAAWTASAAGLACGIRGAGSVAVTAGVASLAKGTLRTMLMTRLRVASVAIVAVGVIGAGAATGRGDGPEPAPKANGDQPVLFRWPDGPVYSADVTYVRLGDDAAKPAHAAPERVEAYRIGNDLFVNIAPPGAGRVLLEKISRPPTPSSKPNKDQVAPEPKSPAEPDAKPIARDQFSQALSEIKAEAPDVFVVSDKASPANPQAARLYDILVDGRTDNGDAPFVRRLYLDLLGRLPTAEEIKTFVDSNAPDKAEALARRLVDDPAVIERMKQSLRRRVEASVKAHKTATNPVTFTLADVTLDRVNLPAGDLIDIHFDNGPHDPNSPAAEQQTTLGLHNGQLITTVSAPATRLLGVPVAVDATIRIESGKGVVTAGAGEAMLKQLTPGMRLTIEFVAGPSALAVRSITARPAPPQPAAVPYDPLFPYVYPEVKYERSSGFAHPEVKPAAPQPKR